MTMSDDKKTTRVELKSKLGRTFYRFGQALSPDTWTAFELTDEEIASIKDEVVRTVKDGGALEMKPNPWATEKLVEAPTLSGREQMRARRDATTRMRAAEAAKKAAPAKSSAPAPLPEPDDHVGTSGGKGKR
jgi:hypothetical protein